MNILFINTFDVSPTLGGTERITDTLCREFTNSFSYKCYLAYYSSIDNHYTRTPFEDRLKLPNYKDVTPLIKFIHSRRIEAIILQGQFLSDTLKKELKGTQIKIIFAHHLYPGAEKQFIRFSKFTPNRIKCKNRLISTSIRLLLYPLYKVYRRYRLPISYNNTYKYCDQIVLLSDKLIQPFIKFGRISASDKITVIPNSLSFNDFFPIYKLKEKEKIALIVSRLAENPKRILFAIKAWEKIYPTAEQWKLVIVGTGADETMYKEYCKSKKVQNVFFEGNKDPLPYYQKASIFLMTSQLESWGLTITEAQQCGVVPVALNSYPSLTDIISNNENGLITEDNNLDSYVNAIKLLIENDSLRHKLASKSIDSAHRFESKSIAQKWINLINRL